MTDTQIKTEKPKTKNGKLIESTLSDGNGLYLLIKVNGSKIWRFNYYRPTNKVGALISFGCYPEVILQQARKLRDDARELITQDIDPQEHKRELQEQKQADLYNTFSKCSARLVYIKNQLRIIQGCARWNLAIARNIYIPLYRAESNNSTKSQGFYKSA